MINYHYFLLMFPVDCRNLLSEAVLFV